MHLSMSFCLNVKYFLFPNAETLFQGVWEWDAEEYTGDQEEEEVKKDVENFMSRFLRVAVIFKA
jgi:hypothetical protein